MTTGESTAKAGGGKDSGKGRGQGQRQTASSASSIPSPSLSSVALNDRRVAASNSTLGAWVNNRRQPSWLANASPVQPSPRPARPPVPLPPAPSPSPSAPASSPLPLVANHAQSPTQTHTQTQTQTQPRPLPQSLSQSQSLSLSLSQSSTSPQLQPPSRPSPQPIANPQPQSPSQPARPAQSAQSAYQPPPPLQPPAPALVSPLPSAAALPPQTVAAPHLSTSADPHLPSAESSHGPSPSLPLAGDSSNATPSRSTDAHRDTPTTQAHFVLDDHVNPAPQSSPQQSPESTLPAENVQNTSPRGTVQSLPTAAAATSTADMAMNVTPPLTTVGSNHAALATRAPALALAPEGQHLDRGGISEFLVSVEAHARLDLFLRDVGGELGLDTSAERVRFSILNQACVEGDLFFLALHQLFCLWTVNQDSVMALCQPEARNRSLVEKAFGTVALILKSNVTITMRHLRWYANFPSPLPALHSHGLYGQTINQVFDFLIRLSETHVFIHQEHARRGFPFLMSELIGMFHLYSPILQWILFRASRRTLGVKENLIGQRMDSLFAVDQEKHRNPQTQTYSLHREGHQYENYNMDLAQRYRNILAQYQPTSHNISQSPSALATSPPVQSLAALATALPPSGDRLPAEMVQGSTQMGAVASSNQNINQNIHPPSPTHSPMNGFNSTAFPSPTTVLNPQPTAHVPMTLVLPSNTSVGTTMPTTSSFQSPYQSTTLHQQGQNTTPSSRTPSGNSQRQFGIVRQEQQQQHQQQQHQQQQQQQQYFAHQRLQQMNLQQQSTGQQYQQQSLQYPSQQMAAFQQHYRRGLQSGAVPSPLPSPVQSAHPNPWQISATAGQPSPHLQPASSHPVPRSLPSHHPVHSESPTMLTPSGTVDSMPSPRTTTSVQSDHVRPSLVSPRRRATQNSDRLIPEPGIRITLHDYPHTPYEKRSLDIALHQAHLRSPKRIQRSFHPAKPSQRYYQAVKEFALEPNPIPQHAHMYEFAFDVTATIYANRVLNEIVAGESLPVSQYSDGSLHLRLRCCNLPANVSVSSHTWVTCETAWPEHIFLKLNDDTVEVKRKQHHSKDSAADVTSFVRSGSNSLQIFVMKSSTQRNYVPYVAVEVVEVLSHSSVLHMVKQYESIPATATRDVIRKRLVGNSPNQGGGDDDVEVPNDGISIDLADPFTSTIFQVPVRGKTCTHLECFDLEIWLNTRLGKKSLNATEPSFVDKWKCPLCDGDARSYNLRIDEFLVEVRQSLEQSSLLKTKSITVSADGSWKANYNPDNDDSDPDSDDGGTRATSRAASKSSVPRTVIELDDD
ncbi:hypothetical protein F4808DRAFT_87788 [Astrocystis sublimbata]|nr:hypothetical protein F4808DRAFT_87788 [Astrocystis sublimbata]